MSDSPRKLLIENAQIVDGNVFGIGYIAIDGALITAMGLGKAPDEWRRGANVINAEERLLMPGVIDEHVHFRQPGLTEKADIATESRAAVFGGVTSFIDMPNTDPQTTTIQRVEEKIAIAAQNSRANYAFYIGATSDNIDELLKADYTRIAGVKLFMGSAKGDLLVVDHDARRRIMSEVKALIAVHAENPRIIDANRRHYADKFGGTEPPVEIHSLINSEDACVSATEEIISLAQQTNARLHLLHISTRRELEMLPKGNLTVRRITAETCPQYLTFTSDDYAKLGSRIKCNPAIKNRDDRESLRKACMDGTIATIATDHAPHLLSQKSGGAFSAASGMPMLQFALPLMLDTFEDNPSLVVRLMANNPATIFGINRRGFLRPGMYADMVMVEKTAGHSISDNDVVSRCGWTPLAGMTLRHRVVSTWINGRLVFDGSRVDDTFRGSLLRFDINRTSNI